MAKSVKEREKAQQEKHQAILSALLRDEDNKYCADCHAKGPRWASWNLGVFLCIRCAGIHRNLGVHISKVKSVNLDSWTPEQLYMVQEIGNSRAMAVYEANVADGFRRPQTDSALETFIRDKYERKRYIAREWIPPKPPSKINEAPVDDRKKDRKLSAKSNKSSAIQLNNVSRPKSSTPSSNGILGGPVSRPQVKSPPAPSSSSASAKPAASADLLGLSVESSPASNAAAAQPATNDLFGEFLSAGGAPATSASPPQQPQSSPPSGGTPGGGDKPSDDLTDTGLFQDKPKSTKESIMALYGSCASNQQQLYGVPGGMYMGPQPGAPTAAPPNSYMMNGQMMGGAMMTSQPGMMTSQPGMMTSQPGMMTSQSGMMTSQPGMMTSQSGIMASQPGMAAGGFSSQQPTQGGMMPHQMGHQMNMGAPNNPMMMMGHQQSPNIMNQQQQQQMMFNQQPPNNMINTQHLQQVQHQMAAMRLGSPAQAMMGMPQQGTVAAGSGGWGGQPVGNTLSTNLWQ